MDKYFSDNPRFTRLESDSTKDIISKVSNSTEKWLEVGEISADVMEYVLNFKARPANNFCLIKIHKPGHKLYVISSGTTSAIAQLSAFTERFLGPIACSLKYILVGTTDFLGMLDIKNVFAQYQITSITSIRSLQSMAKLIKLAKMVGVMHEADHAYSIRSTW